MEDADKESDSSESFYSMGSAESEDEEASKMVPPQVAKPPKPIVPAKPKGMIVSFDTSPPERPVIPPRPRSFTNLARADSESNSSPPSATSEPIDTRPRAISESRLDRDSPRAYQKIEIHEPDVEFIVKNLDTGQSFSSKDIEKFIPKGTTVDPILTLLKSRGEHHDDAEETTSSGEQGSSQSKADRKKHSKSKSVDSNAKSKKNFIHRIASSSKSAKIHQKEPKKLFAQISRQKMYHTRTGSLTRSTSKEARIGDKIEEVPKSERLPVWVLRFNYDGMYMASAGKDCIINVWRIQDEDKDSRQFFQSEPVCSFEGHTQDILAVSWSNSRSNLLLSASMDCSVRLWILADRGTQPIPKLVFTCPDVITSVEFHPSNEELFVTGSLDNCVRVWSIPEKKALRVARISSFVTAVSYDWDGKHVLAGSYEGHLVVFDAELQIMRHQENLHTNKKGRKITGIQLVPSIKGVLVTANDSKIRLFSMADFTVKCKFSGHTNKNFQIFASPSEKGTYTICGSEDHKVYIWETSNVKQNPLTGKRKTKVLDSFQAHPNPVTTAIFAPFSKRKSKFEEGQIIISADTSSEIEVFENKRIDPSQKDHKLQ